MIFAVCSVLLEREGSTRLRGDTQENSERADESSNNCAAEGSEGRKGVSRPAGRPYIPTDSVQLLHLCKEKFLRIPKHKMRRSAESFCLASKPRRRRRCRSRRRRGERGRGLHSLYFICIPSHPIPGEEGFATSREKENP